MFRAYRQWPIPLDTDKLYFSEPAKPTTTLEFHSAGLRGRITGHQEVRSYASGTSGNLLLKG